MKTRIRTLFPILVAFVLGAAIAPRFAVSMPTPTDITASTATFYTAAAVNTYFGELDDVLEHVNPGPANYYPAGNVPQSQAAGRQVVADVMALLIEADMEGYWWVNGAGEVYPMSTLISKYQWMMDAGTTFYHP